MKPRIRVIAKPINRPSLKMLMESTPSTVTSRAGRQCHMVRKQYDIGSLEGFRRTYTRNKNYYNEFRTWMVCTDGKRNTYLRFYGPPSIDTPVWVWCSCPYFQYNLEARLAKMNCSVIRNSNGQWYKTRDKNGRQLVRDKNGNPLPKWYAHLCKHLYLTAELALRAKLTDLVEEKVDEMEVEASVAKAVAAKMESPRPEVKVIPKGKFTSPAGTHKNIY